MQKKSSYSAIERLNLGQGLSTALRQLILSGELADNDRINEVHLARNLGVSRTPLREALVGLVPERLVTIKPRHGFFVAALEPGELADLYAMRALLDPHALALGGLPSARQLAALKILNSRLRSAEQASRAVDLDNTWHRTLLDQCPNQLLIQTIEQFIVLTQRYELAYFRETSHVEIAFEEHDALLVALEHGNLENACEALRQNMQSSIEPLLHWLINRRH